jgi:hypothetical protein
MRQEQRQLKPSNTYRNYDTAKYINVVMQQIFSYKKLKY